MTRQPIINPLSRRPAKKMPHVAAWRRQGTNDNVDHNKPGSQSDANARDAAVAASLALQFGCPLHVLQRAVLRDPQGRPSTALGAALDLIIEDEAMS